MPRYEPAGDAFQQASFSVRVSPTPEERGEPFPSYLQQPDPNLLQVLLPDPALFSPPENDFLQLAVNRRSLRRAGRGHRHSARDGLIGGTVTRS